MRNRSSSPLAQYQVTRVQEKVNLQNLNDRLAAYIDKVRHLEEDNGKLQNIISTYTEKHDKQFKQIKSIYDEELKESRRTLDELAKERAKLDIDARKYKADYDDTSLRLNKKELEFVQFEKYTKRLEDENSELKSKCDKLMNDAGRRTAELNEFRLRAAELERQLSDARRQLEDETLLRVDAENQNVSLKEELQFKNQVHNEEVEQIRSEKRVEIHEVDRIKEEYDNKLIIELNRIRNDTDAKIREMRDEVEMCYERKLKEAEDAMRRNDSMLDQIREDLASARNKITEIGDQNSILQRKSMADEEKIRKLEDKLADIQHKDNEANQYRDNQLRKIQDEYNNLRSDYQSLLDVKISLDQEICAYRKLLESEESRLNLSLPNRTSEHDSGIIRNEYLSQGESRDQSSLIDHTSNSDSMLSRRSRGTTGGENSITHATSQASNMNPECESSNSIIGDSIMTRSARKRRFEEQIDQSKTSSSFSSSCVRTGAIEISEEDNENGLFLTVYNNSSSSVNIGGWLVQRKCVSDGKITEFRFPLSTILGKNKSTVIWSSRRKSFVTSSPPDVFVLTFQEWPVGDHTITTVRSSDGQEACKRESTRRTNGSIGKKFNLNKHTLKVVNVKIRKYNETTFAGNGKYNALAIKLEKYPCFYLPEF
ncbi:hypothetical protein GJ496_011415 [Pomphorhynchus laevis]|nr:hypothetical protein GJ496_011415 [Pomphorhynchus laevis]